jgi:nucleoside 2-deoxyribosyltransferase
MKERIYISGPITGYKNNNREAFEEIENKLNSEGFEAVNLIKVCESLGDKAPYGEYMRFDIRALTYCDSIYMLKGWKQSKGAMIEHLVAMAMGLKVIDYNE